MTFEDLEIRTKPGRQRYATICPKCNETRQHHKGALCLTVNDEEGNQWYKCHHCGWSGNLGAGERYEQVREKSRIPNQQRVYTLKVRDYLKKRGISQTTAKSKKIYEATALGHTVICFPFFMNLTLVNVKFLNMEWKKGDKRPKWTQLPKDLGTRIIPFGMQDIKTHDDVGDKIPRNTCIITEGEWDMLTWVECGYNNVISIPQGAPSLKAKKFEKEFAYLQDKYVLSVFKDIDIFYLAVDNDAAGIKLRGHLAMILGKVKCRIIKYPVGYKDINEVFVGDKKKKLLALGEKGVKGCLQDATSVPISGVIKASQVRNELTILRNDGFQPGLSCGVPGVDHLFTVKPKHITFITGVPGCFGGDQKIHTSIGVNRISDIKEGDFVLCYNHQRSVNEFRKVLKTHKYDEIEDKLYRITLKDGTVIKVTENHEFFNGVRYVKVKDIIVSLEKK